MIRLLPSRSVAVVLVPLLALGACNSASTPQASSTASGEILPGSVSDAMLDTDRSQAQAPLAPAARSAAAKVDDGASADASDAAADPAATTDIVPADPATAGPKAAAAPKAPNP
jgi:hypothetical protein